MNFRDKGIIISKHLFKDSLQIVTLLTENHGLHSSLFRSQKYNGSTLEGNIVDYFWQSRLEDQLGFGKCELITSYHASLMTSKTKLYAFNSLVSLIKASFAERESHPNLFHCMKSYMYLLKNNFCLREYFTIELSILEEAGYGLDLNQCADTKRSDDLYYVSPKSGKAISKSSGLPFASKLLRLPTFLDPNLTEHTQKTSNRLNYDYLKQDIIHASNLCGYFFGRYIFQKHKMPIARCNLINHLIHNSPQIFY